MDRRLTSAFSAFRPPQLVQTPRQVHVSSIEPPPPNTSPKNGSPILMPPFVPSVSEPVHHYHSFSSLLHNGSMDSTFPTSSSSTQLLTYPSPLSPPFPFTSSLTSSSPPPLFALVPFNLPSSTPSLPPPQTSIVPSAISQSSAPPTLLEASSKKTTRKKGETEQWTKARVLCLLDLFEEKWISLNKGNFKVKHWLSISTTLNSQCGSTFSDAQCKNKWDSLCKTYKVEKDKENVTGAEPSHWDYYERMQDILAKTPKIRGLVGGYTGDAFTGVEWAREGEDVDEVEEQGADHNQDSTSPGTQTSTPKDSQQPSPVEGAKTGEAVQGHRNKKKRRISAGSSLAMELKDGMVRFTDAMKEIELRRIEAETSRAEKALEAQLQIARLLAGNHGL